MDNHVGFADQLPERSPRSVWAILLLLVGVMGLLAFVWSISKVGESSRNGIGPEHPGVGKPLGLVKLERLTGDGESIDSATLAGKVVLINFWATWCPPCRDEFPGLAALQFKLRNERRFQFLSVAQGVNQDELRADTEKFLSEQETVHPTYWDPAQITAQSVQASVGFSGLPTTLILDRRGIVRGVWAGYYPGAERAMENLIRKLLSEDAPADSSDLTQNDLPESSVG